MMNTHEHAVPRKVIYLLDSFPVLSQTFVLQELLELDRQGVPLDVFALSEPPPCETASSGTNAHIPVTYISRQPGVQLLRLLMRRCFKTPLRFLRAALLTLAHHHPRPALSYLRCGAFVAERIERQHIAHLHAHFAVGAASVAQIVYLLTGVPYSFTAHAYDIYLTPKAILAYKMRMARFVVTCSVYNQRYLQQLVDGRIGRRIYCIYVGLNLRLFPTDSDPLADVSQPPLILAVCRLVEKKGLLDLLSACHMLKGQGYRFTCRIVGDGPQRPLLEQKMRVLDLADCVELPGAAAHEQALAMYRQATVVALPCIITADGDRDGIPNALMEALCMRVPAVSTSVSGIPELISHEDNGLLVPPQDSTALAAALARLLDNPDLRVRLAAAGRETVVERFDVAKNVRHLAQLFYACSPKE